MYSHRRMCRRFNINNCRSLRHLPKINSISLPNNNNMYHTVIYLKIGLHFHVKFNPTACQGLAVFNNSSYYLKVEQRQTITLFGSKIFQYVDTKIVQVIQTLPMMLTDNTSNIKKELLLLFIHRHDFETNGQRFKPFE